VQPVQQARQVPLVRLEQPVPLELQVQSEQPVRLEQQGRQA
jgi:hypothetical protein